MDKNDARIEARVPQQAYDDILSIADYYGVPLSQVVRWAIRDYVASEADAVYETEQAAQQEALHE